jgi:hypothetical protein
MRKEQRRNTVTSFWLQPEYERYPYFESMEMLIRKAAVLAITILYLLVPCSGKVPTGNCGCGCRASSGCCSPSIIPCQVASLVECRCHIEDESYVKPPEIVSSWPEIAVIFFAIDTIDALSGSLPPGHRQPPMKPPPV